MPNSKIPPELQQCIEECSRCHQVCLSTAANHCLEAGGPHVEPTHYRTMLDCAQICATSADFMLRNSRLHAPVCRACAEICEACARSCEEVGGMPECVDACRRCAESCRRMAVMAVETSEARMTVPAGAAGRRHAGSTGREPSPGDLETSEEQELAEAISGRTSSDV